MKTRRGRQTRYPYSPSMQRLRPVSIKPLSPVDALCRLLGRVFMETIADCDRLKKSAITLIRSKELAVASLKNLAAAESDFTEQLSQARVSVPWILDSSVDQKTRSQAIIARVRRAVLDKLDQNQINLIRKEGDYECPICDQFPRKCDESA